MKIEQIKAIAQLAATDGAEVTPKAAQILARALLAGIAAAQNADEITDRYGDGHRSMGRKVLRAMEDAT